MGKIVKYCSSCDEGFAEKFGYCPNCAAPLQAFEMNPLNKEVAPEEPAVEIPPAVEYDSAKTIEMTGSDNTILDLADDVPETAEMPVEETQSYFADAPADDEPIEVANADVIEDEVEEPSVVGQPVWVSAPERAHRVSSPSPADSNAASSPTQYSRDDDGGFYVTVIQEKNGAQRNLLLLGALVLMVSVAFGSYILSMFQKEMFVGAIGDERSLAMLIDDVPMPIEDKPEEKKEDKGGGGGGGGKEDPKPVNQGDLPDQTPDPIRPPDPKIPKLSDPALKLPDPSTQGNLKTEKKYGQWGDPNSKFGELSSGPGSGGGMGTGIGTGAGSGRGTGMGSGTGSGSGSGFGDGNGDGTGGGGGVGAPPPKPVGVTSAVKILSKPQAKYNDAGRTQGVQGSVRLKVTLLANGSVGSITPVTRLPHGLTEQAIAAARLIRFEPKKVNGQPVATTVTIDYSFSIY